MGIPTDVTVRLMIDTVAFAITNSVFQTVTGSCFPLLSGSLANLYGKKYVSYGL